MNAPGTTAPGPDGTTASAFEWPKDAFDLSRPLPTFFIVGAPKAGTTSLHAYLSAHPDIFMSSRKEPHYSSTFKVKPDFDNFVPPIRHSAEYQDLFRQSVGFQVVGESSTSYLSDPIAAARIKAVVPNAKIIISLRNPVERAYSHYLMECREGRETRTFREALDADANSPVRGWGVSLQYVELGLYSRQVQTYITLFGRTNVLVILFEEFSRDTARVMRDVAHFLRVDPARYPAEAFDAIHHSFAASRGRLARWILRCKPIRVWAKRWVPRSWRWTLRDTFLFKRISKPDLDSEVRGSLAEQFRVDIGQLEELLERDFEVLKHTRYR